ncbi:MAG: MinD/ParA family protein [Pseudomonadales bacterium]|nr:MinD/ParA family protein [Pseudomonadales bacterium]
MLFCAPNPQSCPVRRPIIISDNILSSHKPEKASQPARCIAVSSGKGGVGKTSISTNLALALSLQGKRVCVFDADTSLANVNILLNLHPENTLEQLLNGSCTLEQIILTGPAGIHVIPAASGIAELSTLSASQQHILVSSLKELEQNYDYLIIDTAAGIAENVLVFLQAVQHCLLVITPEPTSLTDAFALLKVMRHRRASNSYHVLVNMADSYPESVDMYKRLSGAASKYLRLSLNYFGYLPRDTAMRKAVQQQVPVLISYPGSAASHRFQSLGESIHRLFSTDSAYPQFSRFWEEQLQASLPQDTAMSARNRTPAGAATKAQKRRSSHTNPTTARPGYPKTHIIRLQQHMVQLIKSRSLSGNAMQSLLASLLRCADRYYPELDTEQLTKTRAHLGHKEHQLRQQARTGSQTGQGY